MRYQRQKFQAKDVDSVQIDLGLHCLQALSEITIQDSLIIQTEVSSLLKMVDRSEYL